MLKDITLGQFFPGSSPLHRADPRMKIILTFLFIIFAFLAKSTLSYIILVAFTVFITALSRIKFPVIVKGLKPIIFILAFTAVFNVFWTTGKGDPLFSWKIIKIYKEGIVFAVKMVLRASCILSACCVLLTYTTSPITLTDGIESLLKPLKLIHVPVHVFAMMMTIALRFIPTLIEETDKIINAQKARGADFESGGLIKRTKALLPILIPLFASSFRRGGELATAMECRCYRGDNGRTRMTVLHYHTVDIVLLAVMVVFGASVILSNIFLSGFLAF